MLELLLCGFVIVLLDLERIFITSFPHFGMYVFVVLLNGNYYLLHINDIVINWVLIGVKIGQ